jgi:elongation factor 1-gamma
MSAYTLHTEAGSFRAFKILIAAEYNGVNVAIPPFKAGDNEKPAFLAKSPLGKLPVLDTPAGSLTESNAIARYVAGLRQDTDLTGTSFFASAQVDSWVSFCSNDLELPATLWTYPVLGYIPADAAVAAKAKADVARALTVIENHLADKTYLVGDKVTLADITVVSTLVYPFKFVADAQFRSGFPNTMRWFETCVNQKQFLNVIGTVALCEKELAAGTATPMATKAGKEKKEKAPKAPKEKKEKAPKEKVVKEVEVDLAPEPDVPKAPKEEHIFKIMDKEAKSPFSMDAWKKTYSNEEYEASMKYFWENADWEGWSLWRGDYKYDSENTVLFMTSNLIGGFMQRTDEIRKWLFGAMGIRGTPDEKDLKITAYYFIRGQDIQPLITCNDDAECYNWSKVAGKDLQVSDVHRANWEEILTSETTLEGETLLDSMLFK